MERVAVALSGGGAYRASVRGHEFTADQPPEAGGEGLGPAPVDLFVAPPASCVGFQNVFGPTAVNPEFTAALPRLVQVNDLLCPLRADVRLDATGALSLPRNVEAQQTTEGGRA